MQNGENILFTNAIVVVLLNRTEALGMTNGIVQSDVDLAERLLAAGCQESSIIAWLGLRGVEAYEATQLLISLRKNQPVKLACPFSVPPNMRRSRSRRGPGSSGRHRRRRESRRFGKKLS